MATFNPSTSPYNARISIFSRFHCYGEFSFTLRVWTFTQILCAFLSLSLSHFVISSLTDNEILWFAKGGRRELAQHDQGLSLTRSDETNEIILQTKRAPRH